MAKLAVTATVIFFLFALCHAFIPLDLPENEDVPGSVPDAMNMILLPSEKPESEPAIIVELEPETSPIVETQPKLEEADVTVTELTVPTESDDSVSIPLKTISFRPTDRLFRSRPIPLYFRHGHRCRFHRFHHLRHHQHHDHEKSEDQIREFKQWGSKPIVHSTIDREVPYGNDMILSSGNEDSSSDRGMVRQAPAKWRRFGHGGPRFHIDDDVDTKMKMKRHHRHVEGQEWDREEHEEREHKHRHEHEHEHEHKHEDGFMRKIRKFLNHHF
ncbi:hypothetical protein CFP56_016743 [Quercus suber]|uniref:Uncharacterized protein n=1 Tax=Quercus suber TaxID=58331 RepID=A0AAW0KLJ7_QUESU